MSRARVFKSPFKSWWALSRDEKVEVARIVVLACAAEAAVKLVRLPRLTSMLGITLIDHDRHSDASSRTGFKRLERAEIERRARMVDRVYRHWPRKSSCLRRALVLGYRIRRAHPTLLIGVAREDGIVRAHAWIELEGRVVGSESGDWAPLRSHENTA